LLCQIIALLMARSNNLQVSWADILRHVAHEASEDGAVARIFETFNLDDIAADIRVCSFLRFGDDGTLRFAHKSFMEFLVAQFIFEQNLVRLNVGPLAMPLSQEMLFFLSEFAKVNREFAGRICVGRLLQATRKPRKLNQEQFETIRRNMFATNLIANFERKNLSVERLAIASLQFSEAEIETFRLYDSDISDVSMSGFKVGLATFTDCNMNRVELTSWSARTIEMSGKTSGIRMSGCQSVRCNLASDAGDVTVSDSEFDNLCVRLTDSAKLSLERCEIGVVEITSVGESTDFRGCRLRRLEYAFGQREEDLVRMAQSLGFRECSGEIENLRFGRIDKKLFQKMDECKAKGLFFLDSELWEQASGETKGSFVRRDNMILVRVGAANEILQDLRDDAAGKRSSDLRAIIRSITQV
jgi:uncharacterized protein YjbI with pentapeptide repeats